jgi:hypothetical protein
MGVADDWVLAVPALGKLTGNPSERFRNKVDIMKNVKIAKMTSIIGTILIWAGISGSSGRRMIIYLLFHSDKNKVILTSSI